MEILVCVKQVPDTTEIKIDPVTNTLIRTGVPSIMSPFDEYAVEQALKLKEENGGKVTVVTMGPPQAKTILEHALAMGADDAYLVTDRKFGGSDTLATSYILASAVKTIGPFDLILCGKQAIDGDTGQVGPEMAEHLGIAQATYVCSISENGSCLEVLRDCSKYQELISIEKPAVVTVIKNESEPRFETIEGRLRANRYEIKVLDASSMTLQEGRLGLSGSPTRVKKTFTPERKTECEWIEGSDTREKVSNLYKALNRASVI